MSDNPEPNPPISSESVTWEDFTHGERFGARFRHLTAAAVGQTYKVGVSIEELPPGRQACPFHYHIHEEEHLLILEGQLTLRLGEDRHTMKAGDYVCFPAGQKIGHALINETGAVCKYIVIGENNPNEVCVYPDSNKVAVRALGERYDKSATLDYFDREDV